MPLTNLYHFVAQVPSGRGSSGLFHNYSCHNAKRLFFILYSQVYWFLDLFADQLREEFYEHRCCRTRDP
jgi:hypothetical protein